MLYIDTLIPPCLIALGLVFTLCAAFTKSPQKSQLCAFPKCVSFHYNLRDYCASLAKVT